MIKSKILRSILAVWVVVVIKQEMRLKLKVRLFKVVNLRKVTEKGILEACLNLKQFSHSARGRENKMIKVSRRMVVWKKTMKIFMNGIMEIREKTVKRSQGNSN